VCYSLPEIYVKSVYLIVILAEGVMKSMNILSEARAMKAWEHLIQRLSAAGVFAALFSRLVKCSELYHGLDMQL
jgi:hypothetical protein